jgi:hypothetical protein
MIAQIQTLPRAKSNEKSLQANLWKIPGEEYPEIDLFEPTINSAIIIILTYGRLTLARDLKLRKDSEVKALFQAYQ